MTVTVTVTHAIRSDCDSGSAQRTALWCCRTNAHFELCAHACICTCMLPAQACSHWNAHPTKHARMYVFINQVYYLRLTITRNVYLHWINNLAQSPTWCVLLFALLSCAPWQTSLVVKQTSIASKEKENLKMTTTLASWFGASLPKKRKCVHIYVCILYIYIYIYIYIYMRYRFIIYIYIYIYIYIHINPYIYI